MDAAGAAGRTPRVQLPHRSYNDGKALMPQFGYVETPVAVEKGWLAETLQ
ncbi:MAG: hypothetical protein ABSB35_22205 [Bryobacteraceae bacterium]